jgi:hypothetical protein
MKKEPDPITLADLALELGMDRSGLRRLVVRLNLPMVKIRTYGGRNQLSSALSKTDADKVRAYRADFVRMKDR